MLRRLILLLSALLITCALGLTATNVGGPTGAHAAGGYGVGPSQTGATGTARTCEATAANHGVSALYGLNCTTTPAYSFNLAFDCTARTETLSGSGLIPGSDVYYFSVLNNHLVGPYTVAPDGTWVQEYGLPVSYGDTITFYAYASGATPGIDSPYYSSGPFSFSCPAV